MARTKTTTPEPPGENTPVAAATPVTETASATADRHVQALLRCFRAYPSLYIDRQGGVYTRDTAESLRADAVLYENPYYQPKNPIR